MSWFFRISILLLFCSTIPMSGCINLGQDHARKGSYLLNVSRGDGPPHAEPPSEAILQIGKLRISPRFEEDKLVYRMDENTYVADYYNRFLVSPAIMISEEVSQWMESTGLFKHVLEGSSRLEPDYFLEGNVPVLYGDFTEAPPLAKMEIEFTLFRDLAEGPELLLQRKYRGKSSLSEKSPQALIHGFGEVLETILSDFEKDLREMNLSSVP